MATITQIEIDGFKAFPENFVLDLEGGKNLLLYGENGSGKSSIYYALHAVFQSVLKDDRGAKYFDNTDDQHLININRIQDILKKGYQPFIRIKFNNGSVWRLHQGGLISENGSDYNEIKLLNRGSAFINHSYISRFHTARNSEDINLWNVFHKDILPFYRADEITDFLSVIFDNIRHEAESRPRINNKTFLKKIADFNKNLSHFIEDINKQLNKIYNENFKFEDDNELYIELLYYSDDAKENVNQEPYYLFYGKNRFGQERPVSLDIPKIGISIKENGTEIYKPQTYFNEARLTAIALAVRFACLSKKSEGCFLALDDMLISLDMSNRMQVIRYLMNEAIKDYKLYIFTHDRLFFHTFKRIIETQYDSKRWVFGGIYSCDLGEYPVPEYKSSPRNKITDIDDAYQRHDYFLCGILLRKKLEQVLSEILPESFITDQDPQTKLSTPKNLDKQILSLQEFCKKEKIDFQPFECLKSYKDLFLNSTAHNDISSPFYRREIKACKKAIETLSGITRSKIILGNGTDISFSIISDQQHTIRIRLREPLLLLEYNGDVRISYFSKCDVQKVIQENSIENIGDGGFESVYEAYESYCSKYNSAPTGDLLDVLFVREEVLRSKLPL